MRLLILTLTLTEAEAALRATRVTQLHDQVPYTSWLTNDELTPFKNLFKPTDQVPYTLIPVYVYPCILLPL